MGGGREPGRHVAGPAQAAHSAPPTALPGLPIEGNPGQDPTSALAGPGVLLVSVSEGPGPEQTGRLGGGFWKPSQQIADYNSLLPGSHLRGNELGYQRARPPWWVTVPAGRLGTPGCPEPPEGGSRFQVQSGSGQDSQAGRLGGCPRPTLQIWNHLPASAWLVPPSLGRWCYTVLAKCLECLFSF